MHTFYKKFGNISFWSNSKKFDLQLFKTFFTKKHYGRVSKSETVKFIGNKDCDYGQIYIQDSIKKFIDS